jgi:hypothetical protein
MKKIKQLAVTQNRKPATAPDRAPLKGVYKMNPTKMVMKQGTKQARKAVVAKGYTTIKPRKTK